MKCVFCGDEGGRKPKDMPGGYPICDKCIAIIARELGYG